MEILIQLAGVQLGPYSEAQVREHLSEGLLSLTDPAKHDGLEDWMPLGDVLDNLPAPSDEPGANEPETNQPQTPEQLADTVPVKSSFESPAKDVIESPRRAPSAPPGVTHLPMRQQEPDPEPVETVAKKTMLIGPTAPEGKPGRTAHSATTTAPLAPTTQATKKMSRSSLVKMLGQKTAPLPSRASVPITGAPAVKEPTPSTEKEVKKANQPSLIKALTAKTVPLRSGPTPPASPPSVAITTPLPTRQVQKPPSGTLPPPSVVNDLTKKLGKLVPPEPEQTSPPTLGLFDKTTKILPPHLPRNKGPETFELPPPERPVEEPVATSLLIRILPGLLYASAALAVLMLYYVWSPYHAASTLRGALDDGDPAELAAAIDFPSVVASLKAQIQNQTPRASSGVVSMLDQSIDFYVTPDNISALLKGSDFSKSDLSQVITPAVAAKLLSTLTDEPVKNQGLFSPGDFVVDHDVALLHLHFHVLGWKLKQMDLRPDLLSLVPSGSGINAPVIDTYLERGNAEAAKSNWAGAISDFSQVLSIDPGSTVAYNDRAAARQSKGDMDDAIKDFTQALTLDPQLAAAYEGRGNVKAAKNDLDGAITDFTQALRLDPNLAAAYDSRGNARTAKEDTDGAIADFTKAITIDPKNAQAYSDRGFARQANGNLDGAVADYTEALALKPKTAMTYYNRGLARQSQGNLEAAIVDFDRALVFDPRLAGAYLSRADAKNANHDLDGAIADYTQALTLNPKSAVAFYDRGLARQNKGDLDGAVNDYTQALVIDPKSALAYYNRGMLKTLKNDLDGAIADSTQAIYIDPKNAMAYYNRGFAKLTKGNLDGAQADLKQFCDLAPKDRFADHAQLYLWLIAKGLAVTAAADQDLSDALESNWNSSPDDLVSKTAAYLLGRMSETDYLASLSSPDTTLDQGQHCEGWYFVGMKHLLGGDRKGALDAFHSCIGTGQKSFGEYILAQAELQSLETPAPPAHVTILPPNP